MIALLQMTFDLARNRLIKLEMKDSPFLGCPEHQSFVMGTLEAPNPRLIQISGGDCVKIVADTSHQGH